MANEWGTELWDQFDNVDKHHQHGIDFAEKYAKFVKERCAIEQEYATKLRKLYKSYQPKKKDEERNMFSTNKAFQSQLSELNDIAGQHEMVGEEMLSDICKALVNFCNDLKVEKKKIYLDGRQQQAALDQQEKSLEQTKKKFEKEWKECERAHAYFEKLDADINVTKIDVEKAKTAWMSKKDSVESCKTDYGAALQTFNRDQREHYSTNMPKLFQSYKEADERRILKTRELMVQFAKIDLKVKPIIQKCLDGMEQAANAIDARLDAQLVVEKLKSGFLPPSDKEFEDFTQQNRLQVENGVENPRNSANLSRLTNKKSGLSWLFGNKKPKELRKRLSGPTVPPGSADATTADEDDSDVSSNQTDDSNPTPPCTYATVQQKSRTLSLNASKKLKTVSSETKLTDAKRSNSMEELNHATTAKAPDAMHRKSSKGKLKHDFRVSLPVSKKRLKSMFRQPKDEHLPKIEVSGPITCDLLGSAANDDYLTPITNSSSVSAAPAIPAAENPYDEVAAPVDGDSQNGDNKQLAPECADYSHLPPEQRRKKLEKLIEDLKKDINKEEDGRRAIVKMQDVYRSNPAMGNADTLVSQIKSSTAKIEKLQAELSQHEAWYADASNSVRSTSTRTALSRRPLPDKPTAVTSKPLAYEEKQTNTIMQKDQNFGEEFDDEPEPIGTCMAVYDFEATSDGALSMRAGDNFSVIEADNGDGWTRAIKDDVDGYVPTSYIKITFFT